MTNISSLKPDKSNYNVLIASYLEPERFAGTDQRGRTLVIIGIGRVGREVARVGKAMGMRVIGVDLQAANTEPASRHLDELYPHTQMHEALQSGHPGGAGLDVLLRNPCLRTASFGTCRMYW